MDAKTARLFCKRKFRKRRVIYFIFNEKLFIADTRESGRGVISATLAIAFYAMSIRILHILVHT